MILMCLIIVTRCGLSGYYLVNFCVNCNNSNHEYHHASLMCLFLNPLILTRSCHFYIILIHVSEIVERAYISHVFSEPSYLAMFLLLFISVYFRKSWDTEYIMCLYCFEPSIYAGQSLCLNSGLALPVKSGFSWKFIAEII